MKYRYTITKIGYRVGDGLHGVDGIKWGILDRRTGKVIDEDNPSESIGEARAAARMMNNIEANKEQGEPK